MAGGKPMVIRDTAPPAWPRGVVPEDSDIWQGQHFPPLHLHGHLFG